MSKAVQNGGVGGCAAAEAFQPVGHVRKTLVAHERRRQLVATGEQDVFLFPLDEGVVLVIALFLDPLPAWAAFAADVDHGGLLAHDAAEAVAVVAEAGGEADQETS